VRTAKLQPVFDAAFHAADPDEKRSWRGRYQQKNSHGHPLPSDEHVRFRNPIVAPSSDVAFGSNRSASGWNGDVFFIR
jgi:hypothetical protein